MEKVKQILMFGPGHGHNIKKWLDFFDKNTAFQLTHLANTKPQFEYKRLQIIDKKNNINLLRLIPKLRRTKYDLIIIHGGFNWRVFTLLLFSLKYKKSVFIPWGLHITKLASGKNIAAFFYRKCFKKVDRITCTFSIQNAFTNLLPQFSSKLLLFLWGLELNLFKDQVKLHSFTQKFLSSIHEEDIFIFYPRSIIRLSRFDLVIKAFNNLKSELPENTKLVIWHGNEIDAVYKNELQELIKKYNFENTILFVSHPYLPDSDIYAIWKRANFTVNIIETDGLSSQVMEALILEIPILLSNISTYVPLNSLYNLDLELVDINEKSVTEGLKEMFKNYSNYNREILAKRKDFAFKQLDFNQNLSTLLNTLISGN